MPSADKRERQKANRAERLKAEQRRNRWRGIAKRSLRIGIWIVIGVGALIAFNSLTNRGAGDLPPAYQAFRDQPTACGSDQPQPIAEMQFAEPANQELTANSTVTATISTSCGDIVIDLDQVGAPETVNSFVFLSRQGFYDGVVFHRVVDGFVVQTGDQTATGTGNAGYRLPDEWPPNDFVYEPGVVAMANAGTGSTGSQFFIVTGEAAASLGPRFTVIGRVISGLEAAVTISELPVVPSSSGEVSRPTDTPYMNTVTVTVSG